MPSLQKILNTIGLAGLLSLRPEKLPFNGLAIPQGSGSSCPSPGELSCQTEFNNQDTCCFNYPGGHFLQTQFWDTDPVTGPKDSWTIHGLWPDHCDGSFDEFCDSSREYSNISLILVDAGRSDLLDYMQTYWKDYQGDDASLWSHEWNKHGTCVSTLETQCYDNYVSQQEVVDYFDVAVEVFKSRPSYDILAEAGITPSEDATYDRDEIESALEQAHGGGVTVRCRQGAINEIWYHFNVAGPLQSGTFEPAAAVGQGTNCPKSGIKYIPK
ncbi:hypothetical protein VTN49DRAFT_5366 [Thermomyces lanuginosus]|uniref:uncharacterized protein n=1 Tax=Thermomyces lanuginosus TaxID=5541 RepID=UPI00374273AE